MEPIRSVQWSSGSDRAVRIIDQRRLPESLVECDLRSLDDVCEAIRTLAVRGAPAIGVAGAMGLVASLWQWRDDSCEALHSRLAQHADAIVSTRPTAVNLPWAIARMRAAAGRVSIESNGAALLDALEAEASAIMEEDAAMCRRIGEHGAGLISDGSRVLTHCNAGALATAGIGTALAPVYVAVGQGRRVEVLASETRPLLQGSRLTAWELGRAGIPVTVLADNMAASLMRADRVDLCLVGADRIAANGDVANKTGTYALAIAARHHGIPFYVAAPSSTVDPATATGGAIPIEQRHRDELAQMAGVMTAPDSALVYNPAFDVTPAALITGIITERGIARPPYDFSRSAHS